MSSDHQSLKPCSADHQSLKGKAQLHKCGPNPETASDPRTKKCDARRQNFHRESAGACLFKAHRAVGTVVRVNIPAPRIRRTAQCIARPWHTHTHTHTHTNTNTNTNTTHTHTHTHLNAIHAIRLFWRGGSPNYASGLVIETKGLEGTPLRIIHHWPAICLCPDETAKESTHRPSKAFPLRAPSEPRRHAMLIPAPQ
jgi:hypothetical protein